jgi:REP element-mobilizing transposase RayT
MLEIDHRLSIVSYKYMRNHRIKISGAAYHCMSRTVNGEMLFESREKEVLRKMIWQVADFCGAEVLTYCVMSNHFHLLLRFPEQAQISDAELIRRYKVLYPKPTEFQTASVQVLESLLSSGGEEADAVRAQLKARMGDVSEYMKTLKQRFSVWYNRNHDRFGTLWADRFKSVLVEGQGNPLQTVAAYIDLNPVRAGLVEDPKDYRFCGYGEAVAGARGARLGLLRIWTERGCSSIDSVLSAHRMLLFGKGSVAPRGVAIDREQAVRVLEMEQGQLPRSDVLRCKVRYFSDGVILGSAEFVSEFVQDCPQGGRKHPPKVHPMRGAAWGDLAVIQGLRKQIFG